ncbi:MAG: hypothetical protein Q9160_002301 [Pyrenula sp. 1 TL-2023]
MAVSPKQAPSNVKAEDLVAFGNAAAGHEGVLSNASGSLIYKPCTAAEIAFYESAPNHPRFQALMPTFMGTLSTPSDPKQAAALATAVQNAGDSAAAIPITPEVLQQTVPASAQPSVKTDAPAPTQEWAPSAGHAISTTTSIVLQNVAHGFSHPNVLDLKLGARLWDDAAPAAKRARLDEVSRESTSGSLGFRIAGMKVWDPEEKLGKNEYVELKDDGSRSYNKFYGRSFKGEDDVAEAFEEFFASAGEVKKDVAKRLLGTVTAMQEALEKQESRMYSASVLMIFEGDEKALKERLERERESAKLKSTSAQAEEDSDEDLDELDDEDAPPSKIHEAKLIDFAHATWTPGQGPDENALQGVRSIVRILTKIVEK